MVMALIVLVMVDQAVVVGVIVIQPLAQEHQDKVLMVVQAVHQGLAEVEVLDL
jgi:hypothetical protein